MIKFLLLILFFLVSCNSNNVKNDFNFDNNMSFNDFKLKLEEYSKNNPYPKIDDQMNKFINIAIVGLGQIGIYLYNELNSKKKKQKIRQEKISKQLLYQLKI